MSNQKGISFKCQQPGHFAAQCPKRALAIGEQESEEKEGDVQEWMYEPPTIDDLNDEEEFDQLAIVKLPQSSKPDLGVIRCAIAQPVP